MFLKLKRRLSAHGQAFLSAFKMLRTQPFALMVTIGVIAIALTVPTLFWMLKSNLQTLASDWKNKRQISLYLTLPASEAQTQTLLAQLAKTPGVGATTVKTAAQNLQLLEAQEGMQNIMHYLPSNPLPTVIEVSPAASENTPIKVQQLLVRLRQLAEVEQVKFDMDWIQRLHAILGLLKALAEGMMILLASGVLLIIGNTLRLILNLRFEEIQVLKLIGAPHGYIMRPFLYLGLGYGLLGALVCIGLVSLFLMSLKGALGQLALVYHMQAPFIQFNLELMGEMTLVSVFLGWMAAQIFVRRQLSSISPR